MVEKASEKKTLFTKSMLLHYRSRKLHAGDIAFIKHSLIVCISEAEVTFPVNFAKVGTRYSPMAS